MQVNGPEMMTTAEVAGYLRLGERKIYELVARGEIPCARLTGKLLFPRRLVDLWVARHVDQAHRDLAPPPVAAGSHDPLLEWALRESGSELASLATGSLDGLRRLADGRATVAGLHILDAGSGLYNLPAVRTISGLGDLLLLEWAQRQQGLVVPSGNLAGVAGLADVAAMRLRFMQRQEGAGTRTLFTHLLQRDGLVPDQLTMAPGRALREDDVAMAVADGIADCGLAVEAVARRLRLGFVPLHRERFDLALRRRDFFEPPLQRLLAFTRTMGFARKAEDLGGYEVSGCGQVRYNA